MEEEIIPAEGRAGTNVLRQEEQGGHVCGVSSAEMGRELRGERAVWVMGDFVSHGRESVFYPERDGSHWGIENKIMI